MLERFGEAGLTFSFLFLGGVSIFKLAMVGAKTRLLLIDVQLLFGLTWTPLLPIASLLT